MSVAGCVIVGMEGSFEQQARIAELLAETEDLDWDLDCGLDWHPDAPFNGPSDAPLDGPLDGAAGWVPDRHVGLDPAAGADPADPAGVTGLEGTDPVVRRWRIEQIVAGRTEMARLQAIEARHLAALTDTVQDNTEPDNAAPGASGERLDWAFRSLTAELAVACRVSARTMQGRLGEAHLLVEQFPATLQALQDGRIESGARPLHRGCPGPLPV
jgi:hypothetical protein